MTGLACEIFYLRQDLWQMCRLALLTKSRPICTRPKPPLISQFDNENGGSRLAMRLNCPRRK